MNEKLCGYVGIIGRPNVGKSTLMNRILGQKLSITARKPQTTRHKILGIKTDGDLQVIYVDTPGIHRKAERELNQLLNRSALQALGDVDVVVFVVDATGWRSGDQWVLDKLTNISKPVILAVNKVDQLKDSLRLLPYLEELSGKFDFAQLIPICAKTGESVPELETLIASYLPKGEHFFEADQLTDRSERFLASEIVREKLMRLLGQELPYSTAVEVEQFNDEKRLLEVHMVIWVEREGQKAIVIGKGGDKLKRIGSDARHDLERLFKKKVLLKLWVKVKTGWGDDARLLKQLGYD